MWGGASQYFEWNDCDSVGAVSTMDPITRANFYDLQIGSGAAIDGSIKKVISEIVFLQHNLVCQLRWGLR